MNLKPLWLPLSCCFWVDLMSHFGFSHIFNMSSCFWAQFSVLLLLVSLCTILLLYICFREHGLFSGFHCPWKNSSHLSRCQPFFWNSPQNPQPGLGIEWSLKTLLFSIPVMTDGCFHVAAAESSLLFCSASVSHQAAPHPPYKLKGRACPWPCMSPISCLLR